MTSVTRASRSRLSGGLVVGAALALAMVAAPTAADATPKIGLVLKPLDNHTSARWHVAPKPRPRSSGWA
jgi:ABC-type sugar transport system substrate-binding protein